MATQTAHGLYLPDESDVDIWGIQINQNFQLIESLFAEIDDARGGYNTLNERITDIEGTIDSASAPDGSLPGRLDRMDEILRGPFTLYREIAVLEAAKASRTRIIHSANNWVDTQNAGVITINPQPQNDSYVIYIDNYGYVRKSSTSITINRQASNYVYVNFDRQDYNVSPITGTNKLGYTQDSFYQNNTDYIVIGEFDASANFIPYTFKGIYEHFEQASGTSGTVTLSHNLGKIPSKVSVSLIMEGSDGEYYAFPAYNIQRVFHDESVNPPTMQELDDIRVSMTRLKIDVYYNITLPAAGNNSKFIVGSVTMTQLIGVYVRLEA